MLGKRVVNRTPQQIAELFNHPGIVMMIGEAVENKAEYHHDEL